MKKVQALPVFLSLMLMSSVSLTPAKTSAMISKDYFNPFNKINEYVSKREYTANRISNNNSTIASKTMNWRGLPLHTEYVVNAKDTFLSVAQMYRISKEDIQKSNSWLREPLEAGQIIYIPLSAERVHYISWGDTIHSIANRYGIDLTELLQYNPNINIEALKLNQEIRIPNTKKNVVQAASIDFKEFNNAIRWPVIGVLTSKFGPRWGGFHQGIDIWNERELRTSITAALPGTVIFAGWSNSGYGQLVIIDHGNDIQTYYAHMSKIHVVKGQKVRQGDAVGRMGETGDSIGIHLHFELRVKEMPVNPMTYLPN